MGPLRALKATATLLLVASACKQPTAALTAEKELLPYQTKAGKGHEARGHSEDGNREQKADDAPQKYIVPFAWETSKGEPLALTRAFLKESFEDNKTYMEHGPRFFSAFADAELPRATVVTCSDSRVQPQAWDETSENDDYTVRNFGNTVVADEASIEYGVEHLNTPLLLIVGHTGCAAVKAASGDTSKLSRAMRAQLKGLRVPRANATKHENEAWAQSVIANVHNQVQLALKKYGKRVHSGSLTVIGAVFDFRDDLGQGPGKFMIVDVNGNRESARLEAFMAAVNDGQRPAESAQKRRHEQGSPPEAAQHSPKHGKGLVSGESASASIESVGAETHGD